MQYGVRKALVFGKFQAPGTIKTHRYGIPYIEHDSSNAINGEEKQKRIAHMLVQKILKKTQMFIHGYKDLLSSSRTG